MTWNSDMSVAPRENDIDVEVTFTARAFWDEEEKRWLLNRTRHIDYVPENAKWKTVKPLPPPPEETE